MHRTLSQVRHRGEHKKWPLTCRLGPREAPGPRCSPGQLGQSVVRDMLGPGHRGLKQDPQGEEEFMGAEASRQWAGVETQCHAGARGVGQDVGIWPVWCWAGCENHTLDLLLSGAAPELWELSSTCALSQTTETRILVTLCLGWEVWETPWCL